MKSLSSSKWWEDNLRATRFLQPSIQNFNYKARARINFTSQWQLPFCLTRGMNKYIYFKLWTPSCTKCAVAVFWLQQQSLHNFDTNHSPTSLSNIRFFLSFFFFLVFSFKDSCTTFTAKKQKCLLIHTWENETFQGVEFTEISCGRGELVWSKCDGMTSCCKALRATVSCANDGRKFGSLGINRQEEQPIKLDLFSKGVVINCV